MPHVWETGTVCTGICERPERKSPLGRPRLRWDQNIKMIFKKWDGAWIRLIWLKIGTGGRLSGMR